MIKNYMTYTSERCIQIVQVYLTFYPTQNVVTCLLLKNFANLMMSPCHCHCRDLEGNSREFLCGGMIYDVC